MVEWRSVIVFSTTLLPNPVTSGLTRTKSTRLHKQSDDARDHERHAPHQVEIEPRLAQNREAELAIDHPCYESGHHKISGGMDHCCAQGRGRAGGRRCVMVTCQ